MGRGALASRGASGTGVVNVSTSDLVGSGGHGQQGRSADLISSEGAAVATLKASAATTTGSIFMLGR